MYVGMISMYVCVTHKLDYIIRRGRHACSFKRFTAQLVKMAVKKLPCLCQYFVSIGKKKLFLIDGGPTQKGEKKLNFFENLIETLLIHGSYNAFKLDGIMVTHPDSDHIQGVIKLFQQFPPNKFKFDRPTFLFRGPLLLTTAFLKNNFIKQLKQYKFVGYRKNNSESIDGFEKLFKFYYPDPYATGVVYNYVDPLPYPYPTPGKPPYAFKPNDTSILMLVKDPNNSSEL